MARAPVPTDFILSPLVPLFLSRFLSPWGQPSTLRETKRGMSQNIPSLPTRPAAWDPNQPTPIPNTLVTPASHHPHVDTHPALPLRVAPGLLFLGGPHPLCCFTLYFKTPTETQKEMILAPGKHLQFSGVR